MRAEYFECACFSEEHTLKFVLHEPEEDYPSELYTTIYLNQYRGLFKRIWIALKYVFGYKCQYGHWDCWLMKKADAARLSELLDRYTKSKNV
jgi:hypothetical protein